MEVSLGLPQKRVAALLWKLVMEPTLLLLIGLDWDWLTNWLIDPNNTEYLLLILLIIGTVLTPIIIYAHQLPSPDHFVNCIIAAII